ncbi:MAG TPA: pseudouridine synthase [bacterium]|nr:pseudouridine synthase [bacterium]
MRLQRFIAQSGYCSRRQAEELIRQGAVTVNGIAITAMGSMVDPDTDRVRIAGKEIRSEAKKYFIFYKPVGLVSSHRSQGESQTIFAYLQDKGLDTRGLTYIGRLDKDSEGLMLLTNDGNLVQELSHPSRNVEKVYEVLLSGLFRKDSIRKAREGVTVEGVRYSCSRIYILETKHGCTLVRCLLASGKKRHLRILFRELGFPVRSLKRTALGGYTLGSLQPGDYKAVKLQITKRK